MRANHKLQRIFLNESLAENSDVPLDQTHCHYLLTVLRKVEGDRVLAFNGRDGEWLCAIKVESKKQARLVPLTLVRQQPTASTLRFLFAPLKIGRLDFLVEKATEMGAGSIEPVFTAFTQNRQISLEKLGRWSLEAAEQCGVLAVPTIAQGKSLENMLADWNPETPLIFCDEDSSFNNPMTALSTIKRGPIALLVGPEGGFSDDERLMLRGLPFVAAIPLGPRILRADTAAIAALALVQASIGDW